MSKRRDSRSREAAAYRKWYDLAAWDKRRRAQLQDQPFCAMCMAMGRTTAATVADHVRPHRGDPELFWYGELQSLCVQCHNSAKQAEEHRGYHALADADGYPVDPRHPCNMSRNAEEKRAADKETT